MNLNKIVNRKLIILVIWVILISPAYALTEIQTDINNLKSDIDSLTSDPGNSFMAKVNATQKEIDNNKLCTAINILGALRKEIKARIGKSGFTAKDANMLDTDIISIITLLLEKPDTIKCGGGIAPSDKNSPETKIISSDSNGIQLHISFPKAHFTSRIGDGNPFTDIAMDGMGYLSGTGKPNIPVLTQMFAIPIGADVSVKMLGSTSYMIDDIKLWPKQGEPVDDTFSDKPFKIDTQFYATNAFYPTDPMKTGPLGTMRDLNIGGIETDGIQYNAAKQSLKVFTSIDLQLTFGGDNTGKFGDSRLTSIYNHPFNEIYKDSILNFDAASSNILTKLFKFCGNDLLIITSSKLRPAADIFANARDKDGFWTEVEEVGNGPGQIGVTPEDIRKFIQDEVGSPICINRPSYVAIIGDISNVPTFHVTDTTGDAGFDGTIASDLPYGLPICTTRFCQLIPNFFANVAIGRIPAKELSTANIEINKIINYEDHPPSNFAFYSKATFTSYFQGAGPQDERGFTKNSETIRDGLIGLGYNVERIYMKDNDSVTPKKYYDGTNMPAGIREPFFIWGTFPNISASTLTDDWNNGRFIIFHRDHGSPIGFFNPPFTTGFIPTLTNGKLLPVVFSINCATGKFDDLEPNFAEKLLQFSGGGAVGVIGDSRNSPSFTNNHMALGLFDAIFPNVLPTYGSSTPILRMGDVLNAGKIYMNTQNGLDIQSADQTQAEHYLYHWFGDPTMQIWTSNPNLFLTNELTLQFAGLVLSAKLNQQEAEGAILTLIQGNEVIGRAQLVNGVATIESEKQFDGEPLHLSIDKNSFIPIQVDVGQLGATISGIKFNDLNGDGIRDAREPGLSWRIILTRPDGSTETTNTSLGFYQFTNLPSGNYTVNESLEPGWTQTLPGEPSFEYNISVSSGDNISGLDFGNFQQIG